MRHYDKERWRQFICDVLPKEQREAMERHLYACDDCLTSYMELMEEHASILPVPSDDAISADTIMAQVAPSVPARRIAPSKTRSTFLHYGIAAAVTMALMSSGIFQTIANVTAVGTSVPESRPSYTEQLMNKTISLLDWLKVNKKEARND